MKEVLDYTEEELRNLSNDELNGLIKEAESGELLYNTNQIVAKTNINSLYGALGNRYFKMFELEIARAITGNGRFYIQKMSNYIEEGLKKLDPDHQYMVYNDTDSGYFSISNFVDKKFKDNPDASITEKTDFCDSFYEKVVDPLVQKSIDDFSHDLNAYNPSVIGCEREIISDTAVFCAKKKYFARVNDSEGTRYPEDDPYIKVMGLEIAKSSTPPWAKKKLKESIPHILDKDENEIKDWIQEIKQEYTSMPIDQIATNSTVSKVVYDPTDKDKNGKPKAMTQGTKSAFSYNTYIKERGLESRFNEIGAGEKCMRLFLNEPNPAGTNVISFLSGEFVEQELKEYIDWDKNFQKFFLDPLKLMTNALKWDIENNTQSLDDW